jgi:hypothetical protein
MKLGKTRLFSLVALLVLVTSSLAQMLPRPGAKAERPTPVPGEFSSDRKLAKFYSDEPQLILKSGEKGLALYNIEQKKVVSEIFKETKVTAMAVFPDNHNQALIATSDGKLWSVEYKAGVLTPVQIMGIDDAQIGLISGILINSKKPDYIALTDTKSIYMSKDRGKTWNTKTPIKIDNEQHRIIRLIMQDPYFELNFLVITLHEGRYQGTWETGELKEFPEKAIPHGYVVSRTGVSFIPIGENSKIFGVAHYGIEIEDLVVDPLSNKLIYLAGMGKSPVKLELEDNRINVIYMNTRVILTHSIDVNPKNTMQIITGSPQGIQFSSDGGTTWDLLQ